MNRLFDVLGSAIEEARGCGTFILLIGLAIGLWFGFTYLGVWLWKVIISAVFGLPELTFWQFFGLQLLLEIVWPNSTVKVVGREDK